MGADEFFAVVLFVGMPLGSILTLAVQWYGRRKVKKALAQEGLAPSRQTDLLVNQNEAMRGQMSRLEERLSVMERIATDPATRTAREIEMLR